MHYSELTLDDMELLAEYLMVQRCEYRSPQFDGGSQSGRMIQCHQKATQWTDRGLRCELHGRD